jgi:type I restriction enzyme M protein
MNLMMHGVSFNNMNLSNADTLESDWPDGKDAKGIDRPRSFDAVVANPPYSAHWENSETKLKDPRFQNFGKLAPKTKADYAFVLHCLYHLNDEGTMAIVLPHGVLFRGAAEGTIRQIIIEKNYLDAVIGLPANIFYGTSIPTTVLVFKKNRKTKDILFIDASGEFEKVKNRNRLRPENIEKIVETFKKREDVEKYAHVASINEIKANEFNLNIPRYVDTLEQEEEIDLAEVKNLIDADKQEIAELESVIAEQLKILGV